MKKVAEKPAAPAPKVKEVDLFSMDDDDDIITSAAPSAFTNAPSTTSNSFGGLDGEPFSMPSFGHVPYLTIVCVSVFGTV